MSAASAVKEFVERLDIRQRKNSFGFSGDELEAYLDWSSFFGYLFVDSYENDVLGVAVVYPVAKPFDGSTEWFFSFSEIVPKNEEHAKDICVMDLLATSAGSRNRLLAALKRRYWNWENQQKWALRNGKPRLVKNKTISYLENHGLNR